uniref:Uncharacterized protein n=1 Tax=Eptatretus burgeri TaxID=7764 RepID=A0A8C4PY31_EPTBU
MAVSCTQTNKQTEGVKTYPPSSSMVEVMKKIHENNKSKLAQRPPILDLCIVEIESRGIVKKEGFSFHFVFLLSVFESM